MPDAATWILTASCPARTGIVARVATFLADSDCFIVDSQHHSEPFSDRFFMRTVFRPSPNWPDLDTLRRAFVPVAAPLRLAFELHDAAVPTRLAVLVSKAGHCLNDILFRWRSGILPVELVAVVSNHPTLEEEVRWHGVPFHLLPVTPDTRDAQEARLLALVHELDVELVVLARYMQILSPALCQELSGRCINIHHSFLPGFKGAQPYRQAYERGVKLIGATAHYVTADLDEGPIIEQAVERVDHTSAPRALAAVGRDIERTVLARAVQYHVEHRVLMNGNRTVVFR